MKNYQQLNGAWVCNACRREFGSRQAVTSHIYRSHTAPTSRCGGHQAGVPAWNKGLSAKTDTRVLQYATANKGKTNPHRGKKLEEIVGAERASQIRSTLSKTMSVNNRGGRCKWFEVSGQKVQGTWERNVAEKLNELGIQWEKLKVHRHSFEYEMDGKIRHYTPDIYLPNEDVYLEIKGRWWGRDREKMDLVIATYPSIRFVILEKTKYERFMGGELVW